MDLSLILSTKTATFQTISTPGSYNSGYFVLSVVVGIQTSVHDSRNYVVPKRTTEYLQKEAVLARLVTLEACPVQKLRHCQRRGGSASEVRRLFGDSLLGLVGE